MKWNIGLECRHARLFRALIRGCVMFHQKQTSVSRSGNHYTRELQCWPSATMSGGHGKSNLLNKCPAMTGQKFANVRALLPSMWTHSRQEKPFHGHGVRSAGRMGMSGGILNGNLLQFDPHQGLFEPGSMTSDSFYRAEPALWRDALCSVRLPVDLTAATARHSVIKLFHGAG